MFINAITHSLKSIIAQKRFIILYYFEFIRVLCFSGSLINPIINETAKVFIFKLRSFIIFHILNREGTIELDIVNFRLFLFK